MIGSKRIKSQDEGMSGSITFTIKTRMNASEANKLADEVENFIKEKLDREMYCDVKWTRIS